MTHGPPFVAGGRWGVGSMWEASEKMLLDMGSRGVQQDHIQIVAQLEFGNVLLSDGSLTLDVHDIYDGPSVVVCLLVHCGEIVYYTDIIS